MPRYELHAHTSECDLAAHVGGAEMARLYRAAGYDGLVITDHYFDLFFSWFSRELEGLSHAAAMDRWLRGYHAAREAGERLGLVVLPGAEVRFSGTVNDYLIYGCDEDFLRHAPRLNELSGLDALLAILPEEACVVQAHPFREGMTVIDPSPLFGIEAWNGGTDPRRNALAAQYARDFGKPMTSGSDFHHESHLARGGIETDRPIRTPRDLTAVLRSGDYRLLRPLA